MLLGEQQHLIGGEREDSIYEAKDLKSRVHSQLSVK